MLLSRIAEYTARMIVVELSMPFPYSSDLGQLKALSRCNQWFSNVIGIHMIHGDHWDWARPHHPLSPSFRQLRIDYPEDETYEELATLVDWRPTIDRLHIHIHHAYSDEGFSPAPLLRFHHLQHVDLYLGLCQINDPSVLHLLSLKSIKSLDLISLNWNLEIISLESGCQRLRKMELSSEYVDLIPLLRDLRIPESTLELSLMTCQSFESNGAWSTFWQGCIAPVVEHFAGSLTKLKLRANRVDWPIQPAIIRGLKALTHLEALHLNGFEDSVVADLAETLPQLRVFWSRR
jgi:hypothetical protein